MGKPTGFLEHGRARPRLRPVQARVRDFREVAHLPEARELREQAARCMDCGVPFCHQACPLGNVIPDWNDAVYRAAPQEAMAALHATNNFPEFTGRVCPAPCEAACVLGIGDDAVSIKAIEVSIIEHAFATGAIRARPPAVRTGKRVAVVGSGPAGLAAAAQLNQAGHAVTVYERADRIGGLLRYGIPDFKLEKHIIDRRLDLMREEGVVFRTGIRVGDDVSADDLRRDNDAVLLALGATRARPLNVPGHDIAGVVSAMDYLTYQNRRVHTPSLPQRPEIDARGRDVVIIGGGDTGADCLGTAHRQGARSVTQLEIAPEPPPSRAPDNPWPSWPRILRTSPAHEEGGRRRFSVTTVACIPDADNRVRALELLAMQPGQSAGPTERGQRTTLPCSLVLLAIGFAGVEGTQGAASFPVARTPQGTIARDADWMTDVPGVFTAGDAQRGQSLIVWAMADGRQAARAIDTYLTGTSHLRAPQGSQ